MPARKNTSAAAAEKVEAVYAAIVALGEATANEIAARAEMAYPTVTPRLRALAEGGRAEFFKDDNGKGKWRTTTPSGAEEHQPDADLAEAADAATADSAASEEHTDTGVNETGDNNGPDEPVEATTIAADPTESDPIEAADGAAEDDVPPPAPVPDDTATDTAPPSAADDAEPATETAARVRRPSGSIATELLAVMQAQPDTPFKVSQISKLIDAGAGAVANSLNKLVTNGKIRMVAEKPATYQAN